MSAIAGQVLVDMDDSRSLALARARAGRLLCRALDLCFPSPAAPPRVVLRLIDNPHSSQVAIGPGEEMVGDKGFMLETTPRWLEEASDEQVLGVFAHELGHVARGDCAPRPPEPRTSATPFVLGIAAALAWGGLLLLATGLASPANRLHYLLWMVLPLVACVLSSLASAMRDLHRHRNDEYAADAFAARHGLGDGLLADLAREWAALDHPERWFAYSPWATHPPYPRRKRALQALAATRPAFVLVSQSGGKWTAG